jgi:hypothetical protein
VEQFRKNNFDPKVFLEFMDDNPALAETVFYQFCVKEMKFVINGVVREAKSVSLFNVAKVFRTKKYIARLRDLLAWR